MCKRDKQKTSCFQVFIHSDSNMGENAELQEEELEVLKSIYEGDDLYTNPDKDTHQYKFGEVGTFKTFILGVYANCPY